ncbi:hypothetical protein F2Q70_00040067 [Brassica cretica]|uniref:Uncharacterized protein n=1 Tax=Brassica cretica TaxID=69181 RepID=A0A8S9K3J7_BRACR|nr:hypothetical protein F2Q70_00040067 [Brassica cretica]
MCFETRLCRRCDLSSRRRRNVISSPSPQGETVVVQARYAVLCLNSSFLIMIHRRCDLPASPTRSETGTISLRATMANFGNFADLIKLVTPLAYERMRLMRSVFETLESSILSEEHITPTAVLKSTDSSFDLFFTAPCVSLEPGAQQPNGLRLIQLVLAIHEELQLGVCG